MTTPDTTIHADPDHHTWNNWLLLATTSLVSTIGLASALLALVHGSPASPWPWKHTEESLLAAMSLLLLIFVAYLTHQQRNHLVFARSAREKVARESAQRLWAEKRLSLIKDTLDNISCEFRTPLTIIREYTNAIDETLENHSTSEVHAFVGTLNNAVDDLTIMVNDALDISRIENDLLRMSRRRCLVDDIVRSARRVLERKAENHQVTLDVDRDDGLPVVFCDPEKVGRVIVTLAVSAMKFSCARGSVRLWTRSERGSFQVRIGVTYIAPGIPQRPTDSLRPWRQDGSTPPAISSSFGLGLNLARELVNLNLGEMSTDGEFGQEISSSFTVPTAEPKSLITHYLRAVEGFRQPSEFVALVAASTTGELHPAESIDFEQFLEAHVRRSDLLVRTQRNEWILVVASDLDGTNVLIHRLEDAYVQSSGAPREGPIPTFELRLLGSWRVRDQSEQLVAHFVTVCRHDQDGDRISLRSP